VLWQDSENGDLNLIKVGRDGERGGMRKGGSWRKGRGDYKDDKICDLGATTEESYWKGIESIVFHQLIFFRESVHWYGSR